MRFLVFILFLISIFGCQSGVLDSGAVIIVDGNLTPMYWHGYPMFEGTLKNIGNNTGYDCRVEITCYDFQNKIIDIATGRNNNIEPLKVVKFWVICPGEFWGSGIYTHDKIVRTEVKIYHR